MAILVDGSKPVRCCAQMIPERVLELHCRTLTAPGVYSTESFAAQGWEDFVDLSCTQKNQKCILLRAVLVALQVVDLSRKRYDFHALVYYPLLSFLMVFLMFQGKL